MGSVSMSRNFPRSAFFLSGSGSEETRHSRCNNDRSGLSCSESPTWKSSHCDSFIGTANTRARVAVGVSLELRISLHFGFELQLLLLPFMAVKHTPEDPSRTLEESRLSS